MTSSATQATEDSLQAIAEHDHELGSFVDVLAGRARAWAQRIDAEGVHGSLAGVPIAVKALFDVAGGDQSYGSQTRAGTIAVDDGVIVQRLVAAGAVVVGLTRSHEFGWGITTQHQTLGSTRNPWNLERVPGGSSGGSAAAVAAGLVPLAVASDTGGSIRIPAAFCGVLGLKTTLGRVPRVGGCPLAPSFDSPGFMALSSGLLAAALAATADRDVRDPATADAPPLTTSAEPFENLRGLRVAVPRGLAPEWTSPARRAVLTGFLRQLEGLGASSVDVDVPSGAEMYEVFVPIQMAEAHDVHHRLFATYPSMAESYGEDVRGRLAKASDVSLQQYLAAKEEAARLTAHMRQAFNSADVLVSLVGGVGPSDVADPDRVIVDGERIPLRDAVMPSTTPQNIAGLPSMTMPIGVDEDGLPIGVQLTGDRWCEQRLLDVTATLERAGIVRPAVAPRYR